MLHPRSEAGGTAPTTSSLLVGQPLHGAPRRGRTFAVASLAAQSSAVVLPARLESPSEALQRLRRLWRAALHSRLVAVSSMPPPLPDLCPWASAARPQSHPKEAARRPRPTNPDNKRKSS